MSDEKLTDDLVAALLERLGLEDTDALHKLPTKQKSAVRLHVEQFEHHVREHLTSPRSRCVYCGPPSSSSGSNG